jgi:hypothetical protein
MCPIKINGIVGVRVKLSVKEDFGWLWIKPYRV